MTAKSMQAFWSSLTFPSAEDEQLFTEERYMTWLRQSIVGGILALAFNNAFLLMDYLIGPDVFAVGLRIRLYWCTSLCLIAPLLGLATAKGYVKPRRVLQEGFVVAGAALAALSILLVATLSPIHGTLWGIFYHVGLAPVMVFGAVMTRLRFRASCVLIGLILVMHWITLALTPLAPHAPVASVMLSVFMPAVFVLMFSYAFERSERRRFAQKQRGRILRGQLQAKRAALEQASFRDPLTDVVNRRGFTAFMDELVSSSDEGKRPYAVLLLDVDHFKRYNDGYGHLAGDECLCQVSRALTQATAHLPVMLARWGGEEFVVALPGVAGHDLRARGQQLCEAVRKAAIPHAHSPTGRTVSISVGVASSALLPADAPWNEVLALADQALYRAKHEGRDRAIVSA
ncbi:MAG: GGDEF domain-containing protein [Aquabacterium sp.]